MTTKVILFCLAAFAVGAVGMHLASGRVDARRRRERWIKYAFYFIILGAMLFVGVRGPRSFAGLMMAVILAGVRELWNVLQSNKRDGVKERAAIWLTYAILAMGLLIFAFAATPAQAIFIYLLVALFDGFSQIFGQLFGAHPLAPAISPGKSIEGTLGGAAAALIGAIWLGPLVGESRVRAVLICAVVVVAGLCGDLAASWVKRRANVKDFGSLIPGHGGVLDRFDSFLAAAPISLFLIIK